MSHKYEIRTFRCPYLRPDRYCDAEDRTCDFPKYYDEFDSDYEECKRYKNKLQSERGESNTFIQ